MHRTYITQILAETVRIVELLQVWVDMKLTNQLQPSIYRNDLFPGSQIDNYWQDLKNERVGGSVCSLADTRKEVPKNGKTVVLSYGEKQNLGKLFQLNDPYYQLCVLSKGGDTPARFFSQLARRHP